MSVDPPIFDLQSHSIHSDGALEARDVVASAAAAGVELLALSDHGLVDGVQQALDAASDLGVRLVTAVEISSVDRNKQDLHVLGYLIDHRDSVLRERLRTWRDDREHRAEAMGAALRELGYELDESEISRRRAEGKPIGRPHLADAVVGHPANAQRLREEGLDERSAFLVAYLIDGKPAFKPRTTPTVTESIEAIHDAGGVAVWAHPFWDVADAGAVLEAIDQFRGPGPRRRRGLLCDPHPRAGRDARRPLRRAGPAQHRLLGLPRAGAQAEFIALSRVQHVRSRAGARGDRGLAATHGAARGAPSTHARSAAQLLDFKPVQRPLRRTKLEIGLRRRLVRRVDT